MRKILPILLIVALALIAAGLIAAFVSDIQGEPEGVGPTPTGNYTDPLQVAYDSAREDMQLAVTDWMANASHLGLPMMANGSRLLDSPDGVFRLIDVCRLVSDGALPAVPAGCINVSGSDNDNCDEGNCSCHDGAHYVWLIDAAASVYSTCIGTNCTAGNADGYQGVWP